MKRVHVFLALAQTGSSASVMVNGRFFLKQPLVDIEFDTPELQGTCSFESVMNDKSKGVVENSIIIFLR